MKLWLLSSKKYGIETDKKFFFCKEKMYDTGGASMSDRVIIRGTFEDPTWIDRTLSHIEMSKLYDASELAD